MAVLCRSIYLSTYGHEGRLRAACWYLIVLQAACYLHKTRVSFLYILLLYRQVAQCFSKNAAALCYLFTFVPCGSRENSQVWCTINPFSVRACCLLVAARMFCTVRRLLTPLKKFGYIRDSLKIDPLKVYRLVEVVKFWSIQFWSNPIL